MLRTCFNVLALVQRKAENGRNHMKSMKRLRGLDAAFLYMETPSQHMHISTTLILDPMHACYTSAHK